MNLNFIYVEDANPDYERIERAINAHNTQDGGIQLVMSRAPFPEDISSSLHPGIDLILADVFFDRSGRQAHPVNRLEDIIKSVRNWEKENGMPRPIPIVAYTGWSDSLKGLLANRKELFDIWDKSAASPEYVAWRLSELTIALARFQPDSLIQRLVISMSSGASWHKHVVQMAKGYAAGWTESDQIVQAGQSVEAIAHELKVFDDPCQEMWKAITTWEPISRATSKAVRGHARHVINVFWLGYYLIHHPSLNGWIESAWEHILSTRSPKDLTPVGKESAVEAISTCWFYAGLFHDAAGCVQKYAEVRSAADSLIRGFSEIVTSPPLLKHWPSDALKSKANSLLDELGNEIKRRLSPLWQKSIEAGHPDHGVVAALLFRERVKKSTQLCYAREAARAMAIHNLISDVDPKAGHLFTWESEPLTALLVLCDQIQTWDRERNDTTIEGPDFPQQARLTALEVQKAKRLPQIRMSIDYLAPRILDHAPELFQRVKMALEKTIREKPNRALNRIGGSWPFSLKVDCRLSGRPLSHGMNFGEGANR